MLLPPMPTPPTPYTPPPSLSQSTWKCVSVPKSYDKSHTQTPGELKVNFKRNSEIGTLRDGQDTDTELELLPDQSTVWVYGIPSDWTVDGIQEMIMDPNALVAIRPEAPVARERVTPDNYYTWQRADC